MLIDTDVPGFGVPYWLIATLAAVTALFVFFVAGAALKARRRPIVTGHEQLIGSIGVALDDLETEGWARIHSEQWRVKSPVPIKRGQRVRVTARSDLLLSVLPVTEMNKEREYGHRVDSHDRHHRHSVIMMSFRVLREYQRAVVFMLGRFWKVKGPGFFLLIPVIQQMVRIDLHGGDGRAAAGCNHPRQCLGQVNAVVYFRILDPAKADPGRELPGDQPAGADDLARGARQAYRRACRRAKAQPRHPQVLDSQTEPGASRYRRSNEGRRPERDDDTCDRARRGQREHAPRSSMPKANCRRRHCCRRHRCSRSGRRRCSWLPDPVYRRRQTRRSSSRPIDL
jgi:membrane protein implicated in regulation of membrane protease activity